MKVLKNKYGRGVYATRDYKQGALVERANVVILPDSEVPDNGILAYYAFRWDKGRVAICLSTSSLFNNGKKRCNIEVTHDHANAQIVFRAYTDIAKGEELLIDYGYDAILSKKKAKYARGGT